MTTISFSSMPSQYWTDSESEVIDEPNTIRVKDYEGLNWSLNLNAEKENSSGLNKNGNNSYSCIRYSDVINFNRCSKSHNCVMCGLKGNIPSQNKDVCKSCDTVFWYHRKLDVVIKFCKGCKNFVTLSEFQEKPEASKCGKCRHRGRQNYFARKNVSPKNIIASPYTASEDDSDDASVENGQHLAPEMMLSALQGHVVRPPIPPRRSSSAELTPSPSLSMFALPGLSVPKVHFSRSTSDSNIMTPSIRGICLDLKDTPKSTGYSSSALKGRTPHSNRQVQRQSDSLPSSLTGRKHGLNKHSPRTVSFSFTPNSFDFGYADASAVLDIDCGDSKTWDTGLGAKEWDPSENPLMRLAMLTEHLNHSISPLATKKQRISSKDVPSSSAVHSSFSSSSSSASTSSPLLVPSSLPGDERLNGGLEVIIPNTSMNLSPIDPSRDDSFDGDYDSSSVPNFKLPPRKRHILDQPQLDQLPTYMHTTPVCL